MAIVFRTNVEPVVAQERPLVKSFSAHIPELRFWKSMTDEPDRQMRIGGMCSTDSLDEHGERVLQKGLDFSYFLKHGFFNDNHKKDTVLGYPTMVRYFEKGMRLPDGLAAKRPGWYVEGYLLNTEEARQKFKLAKALESTPRRLGFSIEGGVVAQQGSTVTRAIVRKVAITHEPVNTDTYLNVLAKSLAAGNELVGDGAPGDGTPLRGQSLEEDPTIIIDRSEPTMDDLTKLAEEQAKNIEDAGKTIAKSLGGVAPEVKPEDDGNLDGEKLVKSMVARNETALTQVHGDNVALGQMLLGQSKLLKSLADTVVALQGEVKSLRESPLPVRGATDPALAKSLAEQRRNFGNPENLNGGQGGGQGGEKHIKVKCQESLDKKLQKSMAGGDAAALSRLTNLQAQIESGFASDALLNTIESVQVAG